MALSKCGPGTVAMAFDEANPKAIAWAKERAAKLVTNITDDVRASVRAMVTNGFSEGVPPRQTAKLIRSVVGLTERDSGAVAKRYVDLVKDGMSPTLAAEKADKYAAKLLRSRSMTIARTETMAASNEGQQQLWRQAKDGGLLTGAEMKVWLTADPCPRCAPLDGETVPVDGDFSVGVNPPLHPRCRCTMGLEMRQLK